MLPFFFTLQLSSPQNIYVHIYIICVLAIFSYLIVVDSSHCAFIYFFSLINPYLILYRTNPRSRCNQLAVDQVDSCVHIHSSPLYDFIPVNKSRPYLYIYSTHYIILYYTHTHKHAYTHTNRYRFSIFIFPARMSAHCTLIAWLTWLNLYGQNDFLDALIKYNMASDVFKCYLYTISSMVTYNGLRNRIHIITRNGFTFMQVFLLLVTNLILLHG